MEQKKNRKVTVIIISILIVLILLLALSYAFFSTQLNGTDQIVKVGTLDLVLDETSEGISLDNAIGLSDSQGLALDGSTFELKNNGSKAVDYTIYLDDNTIEETDTRIDDKYLKYNLVKNGESSGATLLTKIGSNPNRVLDSGTIEGKGTNEYSLNLWITEEVDGNYSGQVFSGKLRVEVSQERPTASEILIVKANPEELDYNSATNDEKKEMWTFTHPETEQTESLIDYRYIGADPNNYVEFNNEIWRIIGVFTVDDGTGKMEKRLKIIRNESIGNYSWDNKDTTTGAANNYGKNSWTDSRLNYLLNEGHESETVGGSLYWNSESGKCYSGLYNATISCDFTSTGLNIKAKNMIENAIWYLGGASAYVSEDNGLTSHFYSYERGTSVLTGRNTSWIGKVGLLYPSDYGYATSGGSKIDRNTCLNKAVYNWQSNDDYSDCYNNDWLYNSLNQWTITPHGGLSSNVFYLHMSGYFYSIDAFYNFEIRPVVYLKSNIKIIGGEGTKKNPFTLELSS